MPNKNAKSTIIISIFALLILAYTTYATVYEQIISQHNGFFNVIIFGVVLILVFIFITLIARIIGLRPDGEASVFVGYFSYIMLFLIFAFFVFMRLRYSSSVPASEAVPYAAANYLHSGNLYEGNDIADYLINYPANFIQATWLSIIFGIFGVSSKVYTVTNVILMVMLAFCVFLTVYLWSNKTCAFVATIITLFMPGNSFIVYSYNTELFVALEFTLSLYLYSLLIFKTFKNDKIAIAIGAVLGIISGAAVCSEPTLIIVYIVLLLWFILQRRQTFISVIVTTACNAASFSFYTVFKMIKMKVSIADVIIGYIRAFNPLYNRKLEESAEFGNSYKAFLARLNNPSRFLSENFYFLTGPTGDSYSDNQAVWLKLLDQLVYIFLLLMCVILIVYLLRAAYHRVVPGLSVLIAAFVAQFFGGINDVSYFYFTTLITIIGSCTFYYMYLNHHQDYALLVAHNAFNSETAVISAKEKKTVADVPAEPVPVTPPVDMARARALVFLGENEELYAQVKEQERIERINNPIVATKIQSRILEDGKYESKEESIEFLDNLDEKVPVKEVAQVKAIPPTRPVETVKPQLAESYEYDDKGEYNDNVKQAVDEPKVDITPIPQGLNYQAEEKNEDLSKNEQENLKIDFNNSQLNDNIDEVDENKYSVDGFVFRKKASGSAFDNNSAVKDSKTSKKEQKLAEKQAKALLAQQKKAAKAAAKGKGKKGAAVDITQTASPVSSGAPLENPLPLPKPHVSKDLDYDFDISDVDDYD